MKKALLLAFTMLISCGQNQEVLNLGIWVDNIPQELYDEFTKETGIKVVQTPYTSNEEIYAKVKANPSSYDLIVPSMDYFEIMYKEGLLDAFDTALVPNATNIDPLMTKEIKSIDPSASYAIPFSFGPTAIVYDKTKITNEVLGFEIYTNTNYASRMLLLQNQREVMGPALASLGFAYDTTNAQELAKAKDLILEWKKNILRFDEESYQIAYANGEVDLVLGYPETVLVNLTEDQKKNTAVVVPQGGTMFLDSFLLLKNAKNAEAAHKFVNFIHRPENYARLIDYLEILSLNVPARDLVTVPSALKYEDLKKANMLRAMNTEALQTQSKVWEDILAQ